MGSIIEVLIFILGISILLICFGFIKIRNIYIQNRVDKITEKINEQRIVNDSLQVLFNKISDDLNNNYTISSRYAMDMLIKYPNLESLLKSFDYSNNITIQIKTLRQKIIENLNSDSTYAIFLDEQKSENIDLSNGKISIDEFIGYIELSKIKDSSNYLSNIFFEKNITFDALLRNQQTRTIYKNIEQNKKIIESLENEILLKKDQVLSIKDTLDLILKIGLIIVIFIYPIRIFIIATIWAIKIIKEK